MNLRTYISKQQKVKDTNIVKLQLLKSIFELVLFPKYENLKTVITYFAILSNNFHIVISTEIKNLPKKTDIEKLLLTKTSELIQNKQGYKEILPEMIKIIIHFAKSKDIKLEF